jgi:hypothetical protein
MKSKYNTTDISTIGVINPWSQIETTAWYTIESIQITLASAVAILTMISMWKYGYKQKRWCQSKHLGVFHVAVLLYMLNFIWLGAFFISIESKMT